MPEHLIAVERPDSTMLWLPADMARDMGLKRGDRMTPDQYGSAEVQRLIEGRRGRK